MNKLILFLVPVIFISFGLSGCNNDAKRRAEAAKNYENKFVFDKEENKK